MFEVRVEREFADTVVVRVAGEVDMTVEGLFEQALLQAANGRGARQITVDLEEVGFLDSSGIHALIKGYDAANRAGASFTVRNPSRPVAHVLRVTGIAEALGLTGESVAERQRKGA